MSQNFIGEIRCVGFNFAPLDWALCNGQLLAISGNEALFNLLGTTYGGDGVNTFGLPNLQSRVPVHQGLLQGGGTTFVLGEVGGVETVTLLPNQIPAHTHPVQGRSDTMGSTDSPTNAYFGVSTENQYAATPSGTTGQLLQGAGGTQPHDNLQPYLTVNYIIALYGIYPTQN